MAFVEAPECAAEALLGRRPDEVAIDTFHRVGAIIVRGLIGQAWLGALREQYDTWARKAVVHTEHLGSDNEPATTGICHYMWETEEGFRDFLFRSPIARAAATIMRSSTARLFEDTMLTEPAGSKNRSSWHQDASGWPLSGYQLSSVWFSLQPVGLDTGAMRFVEGSHLGPAYALAPIALRPHERNRPPSQVFPDIDGNPDAFTIVTTSADPGDAVIFHPMTVHTSFGSAKENPRRSFTIRFMGDDVRWSPMDRLYHRWLLDLPLGKGDRVVHPRLPMVWEAAAR